MFHRIKSEPQDAVQKEETPATKAEKSTESTANAPSANAEENISPIEKYAAQQAALSAEQESAEQEATEQEQNDAQEDQETTNETTTQTTTEPQEEESEIMNTTTEATEEQTQEETAAYAAPSSVTGGYPGSYGGAAYTAPSAPAPAASSTTTERAAPTQVVDGGRLVIGTGITMSGEIEACPHLVVEGTVEASLRGAEILEVSEGGIFFGTVEIAEATISGRFEGDITVTGRLTVTETGQVTGSITYGQLEMEAGASIDGKLTPMNNRAATKSPKATRETAAPKTRAAAPASNDAQLFSESVAAAE